VGIGQLLCIQFKAEPQEQNSFLKPSLIIIHRFVDKSVVCIMATDVVVGCFSVNGANLLAVFLVNSQLLHWLITA